MLIWCPSLASFMDDGERKGCSTIARRVFRNSRHRDRVVNAVPPEWTEVSGSIRHALPATGHQRRGRGITSNADTWDSSRYSNGRHLLMVASPMSGYDLGTTHWAARGEWRKSAIFWSYPMGTPLRDGKIVPKIHTGTLRGTPLWGGVHHRYVLHELESVDFPSPSPRCLIEDLCSARTHHLGD